MYASQRVCFFSDVTYNDLPALILRNGAIVADRKRFNVFLAFYYVTA